MDSYRRHMDEPSNPSRCTRRTIVGAALAALVLPPVLGACDGSAGDAAPTTTSPNFSAIGSRGSRVAPFARSQHASALLPGGLVLLIGGMGSHGALTSCQAFDPADGSWIDVAPLGRARGLLSATRRSDGTVLCLGGHDGSAAFSVASVFHPAEDRWEPARPLAQPRYHHAAVALDDDHVVVTGGFHLGPLTTPETYEL